MPLRLPQLNAYANLSPYLFLISLKVEIRRLAMEIYRYGRGSLSRVAEEAIRMGAPPRRELWMWRCLKTLWGRLGGF